jgi:hypothetical protein
MKKTGAIFFMFLLVSLISFADSRVKADDILDEINKGRAVQYKNAVIVGDLDLTSIEDVTLNEGQRSSAREKASRRISRIFRRRGSTLVYTCHVHSPISFINCTFKGDVLAYYHDEWDNETYNAVFYKDVSFQGCEFERASAFKYSVFHEDTDFSGSAYGEEALFKYTKFLKRADFSKSLFYEEANFKYTKFDSAVRFDESVFHREANFKYTEFPSGVDFSDSEFQRLANFKYTQFYEPLNFDNVTFVGDMNMKYTQYEGRSFTRYLLSNRKKK